MSDLISRQDAIAIVSKSITPTGNPDYDNARESERESIKEELEMLPSAEKTGKWIITETDDGYGGEIPHLICSECGNEPLAWNRMKFFKFCPDCGAYMRGGKNESNL